MKFKQIGNHDDPRTRFFLDHVQVDRSEYDAAMRAAIQSRPQAASDPDLPGSRPWTRPIVSDALQVHPRQVDEVRARNEKYGLHIEYRPDGKPVLHGSAERRALLKVERMHDNDGGYADG